VMCAAQGACVRRRSWAGYTINMLESELTRQCYRVCFAIGIGTSMTLELKMLALSIVLGLVQIVLASHASSLQRGYVWTASSRDEAVPALNGVPGRLARALQNFVETFPLFAAAVLIAHVATRHSWMTEWGVQLYFWGRVIYLALYAAGVFLVRSLVWNIATLGIILVLLSLL
jgi:uncharacterized MAPEG superfamily protein